MADAGAIWIGAVTALAGTSVGAGVTIAVETMRARNGARALRRDALLKACSDFTAAIARIRSQSHKLAERPDEQVRVRGTLEERGSSANACDYLLIRRRRNELHEWSCAIFMPYGTWQSAEMIHERPNTPTIRLTSAFAGN